MSSFHETKYTALAAVRAAAGEDRHEMARLLNSLDEGQLRAVALDLALMLESVLRRYFPLGVDEYIEVHERMTLTDETDE